MLVYIYIYYMCDRSYRKKHGARAEELLTRHWLGGRAGSLMAAIKSLMGYQGILSARNRAVVSARLKPATASVPRNEKHAAVLVPLHLYRGKPSVLFTVRSGQLTRHRHQVRCAPLTRSLSLIIVYSAQFLFGANGCPLLFQVFSQFSRRDFRRGGQGCGGHSSARDRGGARHPCLTGRCVGCPAVNARQGIQLPAYSQ